MPNKQTTTPAPGRSNANANANHSSGRSMPAVRSDGPTVQLKLTTYDDIEQGAKKDKFSWEKLKTDPDNYDEKKAATAGGLGVKSEVGAKDFKTDINWKPVSGKAKEGTEVEANLGPDHKLGTPPQTGAKWWNERVRLMKKISGETYIAGHLLNHNLGGPGNDERNLTAIPATINAAQSTNIEEVIKDKVNEKYQFFYYKVEVTYTDDTSAKAKAANKNEDVSYASKITASWSPIDADKQKKVAVTSKDINIPSPSSYDKETNYNPNLAKIVAADGDKAAVEVGKDVVLNNSGFLGIATKATAVIRKKLEDLVGKYQGALKELAELKKGGEDAKEKIKELMDEVASFKEQNAELVLQNKKLAEDVAALSDKNAEQEQKFQEQKVLLEAERAKVAKLEEAIKERDEEIAKLKGVIKDLNEAQEDLRKKRRESSDRHALQVQTMTKEYQDLESKMEAAHKMLLGISAKFNMQIEGVEEKEEAEPVPENKGATSATPQKPAVQLSANEQKMLDDLLDKDIKSKTFSGMYYKKDLYALYKKLTGDATEMKDLTMGRMWIRIRAQYTG